MTSCVRALLAVTALMSTVSTAYADSEESGFYGSVFVSSDRSGASSVNEFSGDLPTPLASTVDGGFVVGGALGRSWSGLGQAVPRTELEFSYREGDASPAGLAGVGSIGDFGARGQAPSTALVGKIMLDVPVGESVLTPYLGAGVGVRLNDQGFTSGSGLPLDGNDEDYSAQILAGVSHSLADQLDLSLDGRYQRSLDGELDNPSSGGNADGGDDDLGIFSLFVRLRAKF